MDWGGLRDPPVQVDGDARTPFLGVAQEDLPRQRPQRSMTPPEDPLPEQTNLSHPKHLRVSGGERLDMPWGIC